MQKKSAGILAWRMEGELKVLLVHPGGPYFTKKDAGVWSIPKGEFEDGEEPLAAARREFAEELGTTIDGDFVAIGDTKQRNGKIVYAWAVQAFSAIAFVRSNTFSMEWPPKSGKMAEFPEVDRAEWVTLDEAKNLLNPSQLVFIDRLIAMIENP
jgi:predicted NUDIX family NTP pyrophosphohydrolase